MVYFAMENHPTVLDELQQEEQEKILSYKSLLCTPLLQNNFHLSLTSELLLSLGSKLSLHLIAELFRPSRFQILFLTNGLLIHRNY